MGHQKKQFGFTIVELLIVVVVIAILAAITIVAYNGITDRAKTSAAQSAAQQAAKKVLAFSITNNEQYPTALSVAGIVDGNGTTYQYQFNNTTSPASFCVTATTNSISYFASNTKTSPTAGACPGQASNGNPVITNLAPIPIASTNWLHNFGTGGAGSRAMVSDARFPQNAAVKLSWTAAPSSTSSLYVSEIGTIPCVIGQQYFISARYAASWAGAIPSFYIGGPNVGTGTGLAPIDRQDGTFEARVLWTAPSTCTSTFIPVLTFASGSTLPPQSASWLVGGFMVVANRPGGAEYADGESTGWAWNGAVNNSTSTGSPL